jgi:hypothetical protein
MKRIIYAIVLWQLFVALVFGGNVKAVVSDPNVVEGNGVRLMLEAAGADIKFPDINKIGDYVVEGTSKTSQSSYRIDNGHTTSQQIEKMVYSFTPTKDMTIPSFTIEVDGVSLKTDPIDIKIIKSSAPILEVNQKVSMSMVVDKKSAYVGEPMLLTIFFNQSKYVDLMKVEYQKPQTKDFFLKEMGTEKVYQKDNYIVHEMRYIATPKYEGNITIDPARARVAERGRHRDPFFGTMIDTPIWSKIASNSVNIQIKPAPKDIDLVGDLNITEELDTTKVKANKPVNLTIKITGEGNLEDFEGPKYDIDGVTIYSDDATVTSKPVDGKLVSSYEKKFVFIADHNFTIPSRNFSFFDYKRGERGTLETKSYDIEVEGATKAAPAVIQPQLPNSPQADRDQIQQKVATDMSKEQYGSNLWMVLFAFISGIFVTLGAVKLIPYLKYKRVANPLKDSEAIKILYPHTSDDAKVEEMVRKLYAKKGGDKSIVIDKKELKELVKRYSNR